jgi:hypothetical protein
METCTFDLKMSNTFFTRSIYVGCVWYGSGCGCVSSGCGYVGGVDSMGEPNPFYENV